MMDADAKLIVGGCHTDERGSISYFNDFDMTPVKRFYCIKHTDITTVRAWRAHKIEQRWFHVSAGSFEIKLVKINDWQNPDKHLFQKCYLLNAKENVVLHIPKGFASSIKACKENSELLVFADYLSEHAKNDDYLFPSDYFLDPKKSTNEN